MSCRLSTWLRHAGHLVCALCPGSYRTGLVADDKCQNCSAGNTTATTSSTSSTDCYQPACSPGYKRNTTTNQCELCPYGYYQPEQWQDECSPCNTNFTTNNTGSTSSSDCIFVCPAGSEDPGNHTCQPCPRGSYRANSLQDRFLRCTACNTSFTTVTTGSTSSNDCNITACSPGYMRNATTNQCVLCPYGYYQPEQWQDTCIPCNTNYTTNNTGSTSSSDCLFVCPAGSEDIGNHTCQPCPRGFYRSSLLQDRFLKCTACNTNFTTVTTGSTSSNNCNITACSPGHRRNITTNQCELCDYGYFQPEQWQDTCIPCNTNYTTSNTGSTNPSDCKFVCPPGYEDPGNQTCQPCQQGYFRSNSLADRFLGCTACTATFTTAGIGSTSSNSCNITACSPGYMRNSSTNQCVACNYGYYQPLKWQDMCLQCNANYTTANTASTNASDCRFYCQPGYEVQAPGKTTCSPCSRGTYKTNDGDDKFRACQNCSSGNTTDGTAAWSASLCNITVCAAGQVIMNGRCVPCSANFYQNESLPFSYTKCTACPPGTGTRQDGQTSQAACLPMCGPGQQYNSTVSQCVACPQGKWNSGNASQQFDPCAPCPATYVTVGEGATSADNCTLKDCPPGEYIATNDSCKPCPNGTYQDARRQYNCRTCPAGTNTSSEGTTDVKYCTVYCNAGQEQKSKTENCTSCLPDFIKNFDGYGPCTQCTGNFTSNAARTVCDVLYCDKGFRHNAGGSCDPCEVGFYKDQRGNSSCIQCPANSTTASVASTSIDNCTIAFCEPGLYSVTNQLPCLPCPLGTYKNETGNQNCSLCPADRTTPHTGSVSANSCSLVVCPAGQFRNTNNMCQDCDTGYYQSQPGQTTCQSCVANYTTYTKASTSPENCTINCPPGQFRDTRTSCQKCVVGSYQPNYGAASCINCTTNFITAGSGSTNSSDCFISCRPGSYRPPYSKTECLKCPFDWYQNVSNATECIACPGGFVTQQDGSTLETDCLPKCTLGEYLNISARTCSPCPVGTYNQIGSNVTVCTSCPENKITIGTGARSIDACNITDCVLGQYRTNEGCMNCPKGSYQPLKSQDSCIKCPPGNTTLLTGQVYESACIDDCPDGTAYSMIAMNVNDALLDITAKRLKQWAASSVLREKQQLTKEQAAVLIVCQALQLHPVVLCKDMS
ncbi:proprotein convertase subtilisin/kexin type 5-like isoform X1 [Pomacea canaliculata]|uniref:proprotein convertase subtilisin/kexin type 5-like isoform X1 n=1 Tax=Pomacea canaliculata TaxID=400727 RepID=UPI000D727DA3|nr:proprotein convertase subtilisin/kexin type 5-like isoform X1 [Pomacea canaliculata]